MSQSIAASLQEEAEEGVSSTVDQLLLYLCTIYQCLIPKQEYSHLSHVKGVLGGIAGAWYGDINSHILLRRQHL